MGTYGLRSGDGRLLEAVARSHILPKSPYTRDLFCCFGDKKRSLGYAARLLRVSVIHHGTIKHHHIHPELQKAAVAEFRGYLENIGDFPPSPGGVSYA